MRKLVHSLPKPLLFGLLGAIGCLIGWAAGEPLLKLLKPSAKEAAETTEAAPVLVFNNELTRRLQREEAQTGDVQISLMWDNINDLDLHCVDPRGERIFYGNKKSFSGGLLDVDMNARRPFSEKPVENIFWPPGGAPEGRYQVSVRHYNRNGSVDATEYTVGIKAAGKVQEFKSVIRQTEIDPVHAFDLDLKPRTITEVKQQRPVVSLKTTAVMGCWTALLAVFTSLLLAAGQNFLMRRKLLAPRDAALVLVGGALAGLVSGAVSQYLFALGAQNVADRVEGAQALLPLILKAGQVVGWGLLGGLLGAGMASFIPNLPRLRASLAGVVGGALGAAAFLVALQTAGELGGRLWGAAILGSTLGLVVALVEKLAREAALVVHWHKNESTVINLGAEPVILGSSREAHVYLPKEKGFPPITAIVTLREGRIELENRLTKTTHTLRGGNKLQIGSLWIEIQMEAQ